MTNAPSRAKQIVRKGDVLFGTTRPMLKRYNLISDRYDNQTCSTGFCVLRVQETKALPKWIFYNIKTSSFLTHVEKYQKGASYPAISDKHVKEYEILLPSLLVQKHIVNILDQFEILINDLTEGLPKEIELRQKQYEYYREQLLDFHKKDS